MTYRGCLRADLAADIPADIRRNPEENPHSLEEGHHSLGGEGHCNWADTPDRRMAEAQGSAADIFEQLYPSQLRGIETRKGRLTEDMATDCNRGEADRLGEGRTVEAGAS
jgi:hypothetical protein